MSAPSTPLAAHEPISDLWTTPVWLGQVPPEFCAESLSILNSQSAAPDSVPFARELQETANAWVTGSKPMTWACEVQTWQPGFYVGARYTHGEIAVMAVLDSGPRDGQMDEEGRSGRISVHDPREAAGHTQLPGLPWGRAVQLTPRTGLVLAFPAWMRWSVAPVLEHPITIWTAVGSATAN